MNTRKLPSRLTANATFLLFLDSQNSPPSFLEAYSHGCTNSYGTPCASLVNTGILNYQEFRSRSPVVSEIHRSGRDRSSLINFRKLNYIADGHRVVEFTRSLRWSNMKLPVVNQPHR